jgi:hypothetical protein
MAHNRRAPEKKNLPLTDTDDVASMLKAKELLQLDLGNDPRLPPSNIGIAVRSILAVVSASAVSKKGKRPVVSKNDATRSMKDALTALVPRPTYDGALLLTRLLHDDPDACFFMSFTSDRFLFRVLSNLSPGGTEKRKKSWRFALRRPPMDARRCSSLTQFRAVHRRPVLLRANT